MRPRAVSDVEEVLHRHHGSDRLRLRWLAGNLLHGPGANITSFIVGFGDGASFGLRSLIRNAASPGSNYTVAKDGFHFGGQVTGVAAGSIVYGAVVGGASRVIFGARRLFKSGEVAAEDEIGLARYADGAAHHIPAKSAFRGADCYDLNEAMAVPNSELGRLHINHFAITGAQARLYSVFSRGGGDLTWDAMQSIETQAMVAGGAEASAAQSVVARAIAALQNAGVSGPTRIPWGR